MWHLTRGTVTPLSLAKDVIIPFVVESICTHNNVQQTNHSPVGHASSLPHNGTGFEVSRATADWSQVQTRRMSLEDKER